MIGETLGPYKIIEKIGLGGMATVYKAFQPALQRFVAVKVLPSQMAETPGFALRFQQEALTVARLEHPHILPVYDFGQEGGQAYIVMRYLEGGTLRGIMGKPLALPHITDVIGQVADALDYAHERRVIHRDVKPSNVLLDPSGRAYLTDFGVARILEATQQLTGMGVGVGTPAYMSPEQGQGGRIDRRSDVYSLGVVLYEMLSGQVPFRAETPIAVVLKHIHEPLPLPSMINPAIPRSVEKVVLKALAKKPADRYQTAGEMARDLRAAVLSAGSAPSQDEYVTESISAEIPDRRPNSRGLRRLVRPVGVILLMALIAVLITQIPRPASSLGEEEEGRTSPSASTPIEGSTLPGNAPEPPPQSSSSLLAPTKETSGPAYSCADPLGCVTVPPNAPLFLAYLLSMSDRNGIEGLRAIQIAVEDHGHLRGHAIQLVGADDGCDEEVAREAALGLLETPSIAAVIGTTCSPGARTAAPLLSDAGLTLVSPSNKGHDLTDPATRLPGYFRVSSSDVFQAQTAAEFAVWQLGAGRAAILYSSGDPYSEPLANAFLRSFEELGGKVVFSGTVEEGRTDLAGLIGEVASVDPDLIYYPLYASMAGNATVEVRAGDLPSSVNLMGPDSLWSEEFVGSAGVAAAEGVYVSAPTHEFDNPIYDTFVARYVDQHGAKPTSIWHAYAYDAARLTLAAMDQAAVLEGDGTLHIGRQGLRDSLYAIEGFEGLTGTLDCRSNGDCGQPEYSVYQIRNGEFVRVD